MGATMLWATPAPISRAYEQNRASAIIAQRHQSSLPFHLPFFFLLLPIAPIHSPDQLILILLPSQPGLATLFFHQSASEVFTQICVVCRSSDRIRFVSQAVLSFSLVPSES